ncbi:flavin reductase [Streptomyces sp. BR123]|jgi:flavin reductase (DIM6/NTAB) family NADH-FMN oxidoreductase RutF|uniref:flavin reductase family protein n=1 Tax=Streptomyces sp. BR123 TaxID=2749828 RepID=UPI0015C453AC|nr:flavin reductase family protein [Streptomyces sp. BR123]NXY94242.1 flavin reductase [Streptomyces sp. BR123]
MTIETALPTAPLLDQGTFRRVMGRFPTFVSVITTATDNGPAGCTANAVLSLSLSPASILVSLRSGSRTLHEIRDRGAFAVNTLSWGQRSLAQRFATGDPARRFDGVAHSWSDGVPVVDGCVATVVCRLRDTVEAFDHTLLIGTAERADCAPDIPMVLLDGQAHRLPPAEFPSL